jgi:DNA-binding transcriptional regulator LsrR (DeoR family)
VAHAIHAPLVVDDAAVAAALRRQPGIRDTLQLAGTLDVSVIAVGAWRAGCSTVWEAVPPSVRRAGTRAGAVAEVIGRLLDAEGAPVGSPLDDLVIGTSLPQLSRAAVRVAVVSGPQRAPAVVAAVRAGLITTLVTTADVARDVLRTPDAG